MACVKVCGPDAIDHRMQEETFDLKVGTIILATGHQFFDPARLPQYHYGRVANILDSMDFERMCSASGPDGRRNRDGQTAGCRRASSSSTASVRAMLTPIPTARACAACMR